MRSHRPTILMDATGASGSFTCSDVPVVNAGVLTQAASFSGTFEANP